MVWLSWVMLGWDLNLTVFLISDPDPYPVPDPNLAKILDPYPN